MQSDLRALSMWSDWSSAIARNKSDVTLVLPSLVSPRITSKKAPRRIVCRLRHVNGQLILELRATFASTVDVEVEFHGTHRESATVATDTTAERGQVHLGRSHVEISWIHEGVTKVLDTVLRRSSVFPADLSLLCDIARVTGLGIAVDSKYGFAYAIGYSLRRGVDIDGGYAKLGLSLTRGDGTPFTKLDIEMHEASRGPNAPYPSDVYWRDARGHETGGKTLWFGGKSARTLLPGI